ncbi:MAG TPA: signal peptidase I [Candidatus Sulfotelmatobacter sp.]|nr:signal peptidase I [Candidatus Sulfotelmatobacter sp.]
MTSTPVAKRLSAALLSGIVPGAGQLLLGTLRAAAVFLAGFAAALALFWPLRLLHWYFGFCFSVLVFAALSIASAWHAARFHDAKSRRLNRWWLLLIVPLAYLGSNFDANRALRLGGFQVFTIPSSAMENTLLIGDHIVVDRSYYAHYKPEVGDIAIFRREKIWEVKRIIALGGDTIYGRSGLIYRDGQQLWEPYVVHTVGFGDPFPNTMNFGPVTLSPGQIFVMGDNRDVSYDSRQPQHGPIYLSSESGKALYIIWAKDRHRVGRILR